LLFAVLKRNPQSPEYALTASGAVAALSGLREQALPALSELPYFHPKAGAAGASPVWVGQLARQAFFAMLFAALVLAAAIAIPAALSFRGGDSVSAATALHSSTGVTGTSDTLVEDLSVGTFVGGVPFVQQLNYYGSVTGSSPAVMRFVTGARQAELVGYVQEVGQQVALPYLSDAVQTKRAIDTWNSAVTQAQAAEEQRQAQVRAAAAQPVSLAWQASPLAAGTKLASTVTFYACIGNGFCGNMANGEQVYPGAAACSGNLPFGTKFRIENDPSGRVFTCVDRGALSATWVDVWFYNVADGWAWQALVGTSGNIIIVG
jgi:hypothetical protein